MNFFIVPKETYESTDWQASEYANVGPVLIKKGDFAGSYAVNTSIFKSDKCFEKYKILLDTFSVNDLNSGSDLVGDEDYE